jgi:hypothetical protein
MERRQRIRLSIVSVAATAVLAVPAFVFASSGSGDVTTTASPIAPIVGSVGAMGVGIHVGPDHGRGLRGGHRANVGAIAVQLGIDEQAVRDAYEAARDQLKPDEVDRDVLRSQHSAELAAQLGLDAATVEGVFDMAAVGRGVRGNALAKALGVAVEALTAAQQAIRDAKQAEHVAAGATELGVGAATLQQAIADAQAERQAQVEQAFEERLSQVVEDGRLTQAKANEIREQRESGDSGRGFRGRSGPGRSGFGGF